jgi:anti-sigma regulatory factor (Ser/Thr protein kinase)
MTPDPLPADPGDGEVSLTITRDPSLVRTVRLVAASLARKAGLDASEVEEVRLAVGETCAVMVGSSAEEDLLSSASGDHVTVVLRVDEGLRAEISGPSVVPADDTPDELAELALDPWALVRGLREDVDVVADGDSTVVRLGWSA